MTRNTARKMAIDHGVVLTLVGILLVVGGAVVVPRVASAVRSNEHMCVATPPLTPAEVLACRGPHATAHWFDEDGRYITGQRHFQGWRLNTHGELLDAAGHVVPAGRQVLIDVRTNAVVGVVED